MPAVRTDQSADAALIERTRRGDRSAYGELWQRHAASGRTVARSYSTLDPDDLVAESFTRIYDAILAGGGPHGAFRPYLFTTIRNTASSWGRARHETNLETLESFEDPDSTESASLEALDRSTTAQAFRSLPTRWQEVLWYSEVEAMTPQQIAPLIGMSANSTAALAYRAREGLRQAWIQAHLRNAVNEPDCEWTIDRLGSYTRGKLRPRDTSKLEAHLDDCARCTIVAAEAREVGSRLALVLLPLAAGIGGATAYSAWLSQGSPVVDVALGAAGAGAGTGAVITGAAGSGAAGSGSGAGAAATTGGSSATAGGSSAVAGTSTAGVSGAAVGVGVGALALAAAAVAAVIVVPTLGSTEAPPTPQAQIAEVEAETPIPDASAPIVPQPVAPAPIDVPAPVPGVGPSAAPEPPAAPAPVAPSQPAPPTPPKPQPEPEPVDTVALPPIVFAPDTAGGLVDAILSGTAEAGASVSVVGNGVTLAATADGAGAWSIQTAGLPVGDTEFAVAQTDVAGNVSAPATVVVSLSSPQLVFIPHGGHWDGTVTGAPGAMVNLRVGRWIDETVQLDGAGRADLPNWHGLVSVLGDVTVRYTSGGRTGPASNAVFG